MPHGPVSHPTPDSGADFGFYLAALIFFGALVATFFVLARLHGSL